jgi:hypothetical protein
MYSQEDIKRMIEKLKNKISYNMDEEISYYMNMNGTIILK